MHSPVGTRKEGWCPQGKRAVCLRTLGCGVTRAPLSYELRKGGNTEKEQRPLFGFSGLQFGGSTDSEVTRILCEESKDFFMRKKEGGNYMI